MKKRSLVILPLLLAVLSLAGCCFLPKTAEKDRDPQNVTILLGAGLHANAAPANLESFAPYLREACAVPGSTVTLVTVEGSPQVAASITVQAMPSGVSKAVAEREVNTKTTQILDIARSLRASTPQCDLLGALRLASRCSAGQAGGNNVLLITDPGLSTAEPLAMQDSVLDDRWTAEYADAVIADLQAQQALPDLSAYDESIWLGLGDVAEPQSDLSAANVAALKTFWARALTAAGTDLTFSDLPPIGSADSTGDLPEVATVTVIQDVNVFADDQIPRSGVVLSEEQAGFLPDSVAFRDSAKVQQTLRSVADACCTKGAQYLICGQTATSGPEEKCQAFSLKRAEAVRDLLVQMGVPEGSLQCLGVGYSSPLHVPDLAGDGTLLPEAAAKNRSVYLIPMDSPLAEALLRNG